jgi:restriction endonuclease Mrr
VDVHLPSARSLTHLIVQALAQLGGQAERHEIIDAAVNLGNFTDAQRAVPSRATRTKAKHASELHHRLSWAMSHARIAEEIESVRPGVWRLTHR